MEQKHKLLTMKPEHFLYKSDGLYYIQNMPEEPIICNLTEQEVCLFKGSLANTVWVEKLLRYVCPCRAKEVVYEAALERSKSEACKCDIKLEGQAVANAMFQGVTKSEKDWIEGEIYTINMEEEIEVVEEDTVEDGGGCYVSGSRRFARIADPKKEPDHECIMNLMTDVCVYSCECGKIEVASNHDKPKTYIPESAPKKEEETQEQILSELLNEFHWWCIGISFNPEGKDNRTRNEFINDKLKAIEIKRKPL